MGTKTTNNSRSLFLWSHSLTRTCLRSQLPLTPKIISLQQSLNILYWKPYTMVIYLFVLQKGQILTSSATLDSLNSQRVASRFTKSAILSWSPRCIWFILIDGRHKKITSSFAYRKVVQIPTGNSQMTLLFQQKFRKFSTILAICLFSNAVPKILSA